MNKPLHHPNEQHFLVRWSDLEIAWRMLAAPEKTMHIRDALSASKTLHQSGEAERVIFTIIAATAFLTDDRPASLATLDDFLSSDGSA